MGENRKKRSWRREVVEEGTAQGGCCLFETLTVFAVLSVAGLALLL